MNFKLLYIYRLCQTSVSYIVVDTFEIFKITIFMLFVKTEQDFENGFIQANINWDVVEQGLC
jgi:hypothetical protein